MKAKDNLCAGAEMFLPEWDLKVFVLELKAYLQQRIKYQIVKSTYTYGVGLIRPKGAQSLNANATPSS